LTGREEEPAPAAFGDMVLLEVLDLVVMRVGVTRSAAGDLLSAGGDLSDLLERYCLAGLCVLPPLEACCGDGLSF